MEGLSKGVYAVFYQAEFNQSDYPERKLVFSVYCGQPISSLSAISLDKYDTNNIDMFEYALQKQVERHVVTQADDEDDY